MQPEEKARLIIDQKLIESGYVIQDMCDMNLLAAKGVIVREYPTNTGEVDYLIFINAQPVGIIEAKEVNKGEKLVVETEKQTVRYKNSKLKYFSNAVDIRFAYESTGEITRFTDYKDINYRSREVFSFHRPEELERLISETDTLRNRLKSFPRLNEHGFRRCQIDAINNLEKSFGDNRHRALIQMATGAGKTYTAITAIYRLLKFSSAKRILFLVDTKNLGKQAMDEFTAYKPSDDNRTFVELYPVQLLKSSYISGSTNVCISTIQRMYSILRGEELDESLEETPIFDANLPKEVSYNAKYPIEFFDFIKSSGGIISAINQKYPYQLPQTPQELFSRLLEEDSNMGTLDNAVVTIALSLTINKLEIVGLQQLDEFDFAIFTKELLANLVMTCFEQRYTVQIQSKSTSLSQADHKVKEFREYIYNEVIANTEIDDINQYIQSNNILARYVEDKCTEIFSHLEKYI